MSLFLYICLWCFCVDGEIFCASENQSSIASTLCTGSGVHSSIITVYCLWFYSYNPDSEWHPGSTCDYALPLLSRLRPFAPAPPSPAACPYPQHIIILHIFTHCVRTCVCARSCALMNLPLYITPIGICKKSKGKHCLASIAIFVYICESERLSPQDPHMTTAWYLQTAHLLYLCLFLKPQPLPLQPRLLLFLPPRCLCRLQLSSFPLLKICTRMRAGTHTHMHLSH